MKQVNVNYYHRKLRYCFLAPTSPINVTSRNISSTSIMVTWQPPMTPNGIVRSYRVEYSSGRNTEDISTTSTVIIIEMLEKFTIYQVQVFAMTVTEGDGSEIVFVTTDEDCKFNVFVHIPL